MDDSFQIEGITDCLSDSLKSFNKSVLNSKLIDFSCMFVIPSRPGDDLAFNSFIAIFISSNLNEKLGLRINL